MDKLEMYVYAAMQIIRGLKAECSKCDTCRDCPLDDYGCLLFRTPDNYDTDRIEHGIRTILEKEIENDEND